MELVTELGWWLVPLIGAGFVAGLTNAIAGSGGLIVLPALLLAGMPPVSALATNKCQSVFGTLSSAQNYFRGGYIDLNELPLAMCCALVGGALGTVMVQCIDATLLSLVLPYVLIVLALFVAFSPTLSNEDRPELLSRSRFDLMIGGGIGFYGGFLGPGMGTFFAIAFSALRGFNIRRATAHAKPLILVINTTSLTLFALGGHVVWSLALSMALAQIVGARIGSNLVMSKGVRLVRPVMTAVIAILAIKLILFP